LVRYQVNPEANWGPASRAKTVQNSASGKTEEAGKGKRKAEMDSIHGAVGLESANKRAKDNVSPAVIAEVTSGVQPGAGAEHEMMEGVSGLEAEEEAASNL
jgi:hypothetical protein